MPSTIWIAVVDDLPQDRESLAGTLAAHAAARQLSWQVVSYPSGEAFLDALTPGRFGAVFLDVLLDGIDGIETARRLRAADPDVPVIFVTTEAAYAVEGYEVEAAGFLLKGESQRSRRFLRLMERLERRLQPDAVVELTAAGTALVLPAGDVLYAEVLDHVLRVHTGSGSHALRMTMEELKPLLPEDGRFFECHRGIVINLDAVRSLGAQVVTMENGDTLPVSRRRRAGLEQAYAQRCIARVRRSL